MKNKYLVGISFLVAICFFSLPKNTKAAYDTLGVNGYILLQVESNGEAWYVYPLNGERYYLGRPADAFEVMKKLSLGAKHDLIINTEIFPEKLSGMILLDVEKNGEAYYIYPKNLKKYYLGRPADAFKIMRELGLGITNQNLAYVPIGNNEGKISVLPGGKYLITNVPFSAQAPYGNWDDQRQQDGCEETSALMSVKWAKGESLNKEQALSQITGSSDYTLKKYGEYRDIALQDTVDWILKDYFNYDKVALVQNITIDSMVEELRKGNLLLVPMNGQLMHNPNFKAPGPPRHMVVVKGYDYERKIFITNDPGTRNGESYEYDFNVFYDAIRNYPTGYHELIQKVEKGMIVVWR